MLLSCSQWQHILRHLEDEQYSLLTMGVKVWSRTLKEAEWKKKCGGF
jgi:hypothetical protein